MTLISNLHQPRPVAKCSVTGKELATDKFGDPVNAQLIPLPDGRWERWHLHSDNTECRTIQD